MLIPGSLLRRTACSLDGLRSELSRGQQWFSGETPGAASRKGNTLQMAELVRPLQQPPRLLSRVASRNPCDTHPSLHAIPTDTQVGPAPVTQGCPCPLRTHLRLAFCDRLGACKQVPWTKSSCKGCFCPAPELKRFLYYTHTHTRTCDKDHTWPANPKLFLIWAFYRINLLIRRH